jgi:hypothetical protein
VAGLIGWKAFRLTHCIARTALRQLLNHAIEIRIAGAKAPRKPVPAAPGNPFAIGDHIELTGLTRRNDGFHAEALLDEGRETRGLGRVVRSRWAINDLDLHCGLQSIQFAI